MKKTLSLLAASACLAVPAAALADDSGSDTTPSASQTCKTLRTQMGGDAFGAAFGTNANRSNAFGKCVSKTARTQEADQDEAKSDCKAQRDDANFAATHGGKTFAQFYGTNKNGKNAYGKCVSSQSKEADEDRTDATVSASKQCKAQRKSMGNEAFAKQFGTNENGRNAFGKCVSTLAKAQQDDDDDSGDDSNQS